MEPKEPFEHLNSDEWKEASQSVDPNKIKPVDRITVQEMVYHLQHGYNAKSVGKPFTRLLKTEEQYYSRQHSIGEEWEEIDFGWFKPEDVGMIYIENYAAGSLTVQPGPKEHEVVMAKMLELKTIDSEEVLLVIPAHETQRLTLVDYSKWRIRCRQGVAKMVFNIFPR